MDALNEGTGGMMRIVERNVSAGDREIFDLDEFLKKYFGPDVDSWDQRFREDIEGKTGAALIRFTPETVVLRDQYYKPAREETATLINRGRTG
jgi:hypothetical protein